MNNDSTKTIGSCYVLFFFSKNEITNEKSCLNNRLTQSIGAGGGGGGGGGGDDDEDDDWDNDDEEEVHLTRFRYSLFISFVDVKGGTWRRLEYTANVSCKSSSKCF